MFPTSHDITPKFLQESLTIRNLLRHNKVLLVSKPHLPVVRTLCREPKKRKGDIMFRPGPCDCSLSEDRPLDWGLGFAILHRMNVERSGRFLRWLLVMAVMVATSSPGAQRVDYAKKIAPLIDPVKLATLRVRGANPRVQKYVYWLTEAKKAGVDPDKVAAEAVARVGMAGDAAKLTTAAIVRNLDIAEKLGCLDAVGLQEMRQGKSPTVRKGPYTGQELSVDHIIPRAVCPELDNVIANLELLPLRVNESKNDKIGDRQRDLAAKLFKAGLLSKEGLRAVQK